MSWRALGDDVAVEGGVELDGGGGRLVGLLDGEFLAPEVFVKDVFANGLEVEEGAAEGAFGLGFIGVPVLQNL